VRPQLNLCGRERMNFLLYPQIENMAHLSVEGN